jgi:hypothetical protein
MEAFKKYLPWIIVAVVGLFLIRKLTSSQSTRLVPQTQFVETLQVDQFAESRASAFEALLQVVGLQIGADAETERARIAGGITSRAQDIERELSLRSLDVDLSKANIFAAAAEREARFSFQSRENDRQIQQGAIDRYYSSRNTGNIVGSISQALSNIFGAGNRGGIFTPPTFPRGGLF